MQGQSNFDVRISTEELLLECDNVPRSHQDAHW